VAGGAHASAVLEVFEKYLKAGLLEDLVEYGSMKPTVDGVRSFVKSLTDAQRADIENQYRSPLEVKPFEEKEVRKRWIQYRRDLMDVVPEDRAYQTIETKEIPADTVIGKVGKRTLTFGQFEHVYGPVPTDVNWNQIKKSRVAQLLRTYAMADEADRLGIVSQKHKDKIHLAGVFYLSSEMIVREYGPEMLTAPEGDLDFQFFREIVYYPNLMKFEKLFLEQSAAKVPGFDSVWIDKEYLKSVDWTVQEAFTPEQAMYF
jgi:hypothetical protein